MTPIEIIVTSRAQDLNGAHCFVTRYMLQPNKQKKRDVRDIWREIEMVAYNMPAEVDNPIEELEKGALIEIQLESETGEPISVSSDELKNLVERERV